MIKVLYINNEDRIIGGATLSLENLLRAVADKVDAKILVREEGKVSRYLINNGFSVHIVPFQRATFNGSLLKRIFRFIPHWLNVRCNRRCVVGKVKAALGEWKPDIVHTNSGTIDIGLFIARAYGARHVWHLREYIDLDFHQHPFPNWASWEKEVGESDAVIAVSSGIYRRHRLDRFPGARWINDAVCPSSDRAIQMPKAKYFIFCAAIFSEAKMPEAAVRAFRDSGVWKGGYKLRMIGHCTLEQQGKLRTEAGPAASALDFPGFSSDVRGHMLRASGFLMTSRSEGLGRVTIEAMFSGCPVIARRSGGSLDIVADGRTGFLFSTEEECSTLINKLAYETPVDVIEAAADEAVQSFSEEAYCNKIMAVYDSLMA